jgi:type IV pilus assembly protein PilB
LASAAPAARQNAALEQAGKAEARETDLEDDVSVIAAHAATSGGTNTPEAGSTPLGQLLVGARMITHMQLADALVHQSNSGGRIGQILFDQGVLGERDLALALSEHLGLPLIDLSHTTPSTDSSELLPEAVARRELAVPVGADDEGVTVAVADPTPEVTVALQNAAKRPVRIAVAPRSDVQRAIDAAYRALGRIQTQVEAFQATEGARRVLEPATAASIGDDAPIVQVANLIVTQALRDRASDVHIEPQGARLRVRFRIDGALHEALDLPISMASALASRFKILAGMNIVERRRPQDGQFAIDIDGREIDVRVSTVTTIAGECCVLRILDKGRSLFRLAELGMPSDTNGTIDRIIRSPFGMTLCAGPTGSGKTTTLYAALAEIDEPHRNIMTIEDPVEYTFPSINQIQTQDTAGVTFATGLRSILRQDPDVILVGEIRDVDTARVAVQSALSGHFVLSSIHATDCAAALHRFLDMGIESFLIASSVVAVVAQRLVRRTCPSCKAPFVPSADELAFYEEGGGRPKRTFWRGEGCNFCAQTGYRDRIGVFEVMRITPEIRRLLVGWATQEELQRMATSQGMRTLRQESIRLVEDDVTTISEVLRTIYAL